MAAYVNTKKSTAGAGTPVATKTTAAASTTAAGALVVFVTWVSATGLVSSVTNLAGDTFVRCPGTFIRAADNSCVEMWYCLNSAGNAADTVTVNWSTTITFERVIANQYSGLPATGAFCGGAVFYNASIASATVVSTGFLNSFGPSGIIVAGCAAGNAGVYTAQGSFTLRDALLTDAQTEDRIFATTLRAQAQISYSVTTELVMCAAVFSDTAVTLSTYTTRPANPKVGAMALRWRKRWPTSPAAPVAPSGTITYNDVVAGTITLSGSATESNSHTVSVAGTVTLSGAVVESHTHSSSPSGTITLSGSLTQSFIHSSTVTGTVTLSGTRTESNSHTASVAGTVTLSGSRTESHSHSSSPAGTITLTGSLSENFQPPGGGPARPPDGPFGLLIGR